MYHYFAFNFTGFQHIIDVRDRLIGYIWKEIRSL